MTRNFDDDPFVDDDLEEEDFVFEPTAEADDEFDALRQRSARRGATFEEMETADSGSSGFSWSNLSPGQRLILAILLLLDILAIGFGILVVTGRFAL